MRRRRATVPHPDVSRVRGACVILLLAMLASLACEGSGDLPLDQVDPEAAPANPTYDQVYAILHNRCVSCHTGDDDDGGDAASPRRTTTGGVDPDLSDCVEIVALRDDIVDQVEGNLMPPGAMPRLTDEQKLTILRWVVNGAPAPCN